MEHGTRELLPSASPPRLCSYALLTPYLRLTYASAGAASRTRQRRQRCQPRHDDSRHAAVAHASSEVLGDARKHGAI